MKTLLLTLATALLTTAAPAQQHPSATVPAPVQASFHQKFAGVKAPKWEREGAGFEAGFEQGGQQMSATFTATGQLLATETAIAYAALPAAVQKALATRYKGRRITETARIVSATGSITYEAEIKEGGHTRDVLFEASGAEVK